MHRECGATTAMAAVSCVGTGDDDSAVADAPSRYDEAKVMHFCDDGSRNSYLKLPRETR